jgi:transcriptional regulator with XRE-family HTH domain
LDDLDRLVSSRIRELRTRAGLSQEKLGELADLHFSYIGQIERGEKSPSLRSVVRMCQALGVSPAVLLEPSEPLPKGVEALVQKFRSLVEVHAQEDVALCLESSRRILQHCASLRKAH